MSWDPKAERTSTRRVVPVKRTSPDLATQELSLLRADYGDLLAHARAAVAAARDGEADPLGYLRDTLAEHGQLPGPDQHPSELLAYAHLPGGGR